MSDLFLPVHCLLPVEIMPGHDHSLKGLFEPESLNSETMLLTWICPVKQGETSPAEVLGRIFTKYQELLWKQGLEREYLRVGFSAPPVRGHRVASHGFIFEASSLVSIYFHFCSLFIQKKVPLCHLLVYQGPMFIPLLLLQSAGVCGFRSFWVSRPSNRGLETREVVQSSVCPADPGRDATANHQWANPATSPTDRLRRRAVCQIDRYPRPICLRQPCSPGGR